MTSREVPQESEIQSKLVGNSPLNDGSVSLVLSSRMQLRELKWTKD